MRISDWSSDVCSSDLTDGKALCGTETDLGQTLVGVEDWRLVRIQGRGQSSQSQFRQTSLDQRVAGLLEIRLGARSIEFDQQLAFLHGLAVANPDTFDHSGLGRLDDLGAGTHQGIRSEEHTSKLQLLMRNSYADLC